MFRALVLEEKDGKVASTIKELAEESLPEGDVVVDVTHSTLNYKDGMILKGLGRLVRQYPHVPGIDFAGKVIESGTHAELTALAGQYAELYTLQASQYETTA